MKNDPANQVELVDLGILKEADQNSRAHSPEQIDQIAASMTEFGWTIPVLVDENYVLIAGHARYLAAVQLGIKKAPVIMATGWSEAKKEAYQITDNRLSETSTWDTDILSNQIKRLNAAKFDMGFLDMSDFDVELFKPTLAPMMDTSPVTAEGLEKKQKQMDAKIDSTIDAKEYEVVCPHCSKDFLVEL